MEQQETNKQLVHGKKQPFPFSQPNPKRLPFWNTKSIESTNITGFYFHQNYERCARDCFPSCIDDTCPLIFFTLTHRSNSEFKRRNSTIKQTH